MHLDIIDSKQEVVPSKDTTSFKSILFIINMLSLLQC